MTAKSPIVREWLMNVYATFGNRWFLFSELPEELRDKSMLLKAARDGQLHKKRYRKNNDTRVWKVVL